MLEQILGAIFAFGLTAAVARTYLDLFYMLFDRKP
jgi:hypothetical protein